MNQLYKSSTGGIQPMTRTTATRTIDAAAETVFSTVADISNYSKAVPHLLRVEFLSDVKVGVGARFRETRVMRGREATTEIEVTEFDENARVRFVSDEGGTIPMAERGLRCVSR